MQNKHKIHRKILYIEKQRQWLKDCPDFDLVHFKREVKKSVLEV